VDAHATVGMLEASGEEPISSCLGRGQVMELRSRCADRGNARLAPRSRQRDAGRAGHDQDGGQD